MSAKELNNSIYCWNVNGIRATLKSGEFDKFMEAAKPAILCLNETKIGEEALDNSKVRQQMAKWFPEDL